MIFGIILAVLGVLVLVAALAAMSGHYPGNGWVGINTPDTRRSRELWVLAHRAAGPLWLVSAVALGFGALVAMRGGSWLLTVFAVIALVVAVVLLGAGGSVGARAAAVAAANAAEEDEHTDAHEDATANEPVQVDVAGLGEAIKHLKN